MLISSIARLVNSLLVEADGSFIVHRPTGYELDNRNRPSTLASLYIEDRSLKLVSVRNRFPEKLVVNLSRVYSVASLKLEAPSFSASTRL